MEPASLNNASNFGGGEVLEASSTTSSSRGLLLSTTNAMMSRIKDRFSISIPTSDTTSHLTNNLAGGYFKSSGVCKQRVRHNVGEALVQNNIGGRLAALSVPSSFASSTGVAPTPSKSRENSSTDSLRSAAHGTELRQSKVSRSRSQIVERAGSLDTETRKVPKRSASARSSSLAPDPDGWKIADDLPSRARTRAPRMTLEEELTCETPKISNKSVARGSRGNSSSLTLSQSVHSAPSSSFSRSIELDRNHLGSTYTSLPSKSAHAKLLTSTDASPAGPVTRAPCIVEPPGASPHKSICHPTPARRGRSGKGDTLNHAKQPISGTSVASNNEVPAPPVIPDRDDGESGSQRRSNPVKHEVPLSAPTDSQEKSQSNSKLRRPVRHEVPASKKINFVDKHPSNPESQSPAALDAHLARDERSGRDTRSSTASSCRRGRSRSHSRPRSSDGMSVASSCSNNTLGRRRVQRSVSRGRTGTSQPLSHLPVAGEASSVRARRARQNRREQESTHSRCSFQAPETNDNNEFDGNASGGSEKIEYDFDDRADNMILGRKPTYDDETSSSGSLSAVSWKPPPSRAPHRSRSRSRVSSKSREDENAVSWGDATVMGSSNEIYARSRRASRKHRVLPSESDNAFCQAADAGPNRADRDRSPQHPSLRAELGSVATTGTDPNRDSSQTRLNKVDSSLFKDFLESFAQTVDLPSERVGQGEAEITRTRGVSKTFSGLLRRRPSLPSLSSASSVLPSRSFPSVPSMLGNLLYGNKQDRGDHLRDDETFLMAAKASDRMTQLHQNSVTTHDLSDEEGSSSAMQ